MERFLFNREEFDRFYNCSMLAPEQWYKYGKSNVPIGIFFIFSGVVYEIFYIPILIVMLQPQFFQIPGYKIMFTMGVIDAITLLELCFMDGYNTIIGAVFCTSPTRYFLFSVIAVFGWWCGTFIAVLLALNRCFEILAPNVAKYLFHGNRTWIWLALCFLYGLYAVMFEYPVPVYQSRYMSFYYDPHLGDEFSVPFTVPEIFNAHNLFVSAAIGSLYLIICIGWAIKYKEHKAAAVSNSQRLVNIQSFMISSEILGAALVYIYFANFYVPDFCYLLGHILWQMSQGDTGVVYFIINKSLRKAVIKMIKKIFCKSDVTRVSQLGQASTR